MKILITGGASGLGLEISQYLAPHHELFVTFNKSKELAEKLKRQFPNINLIPCDFTNNEQFEQLLKKIPLMDIDVLINNAFNFSKPNHFHKINQQIFLDSFKLNLLPTISITQKVVEIFRQKKSGKIITILSAALNNTPPIGWSDYVASKAYLYSLTKSWAVENSKFGITSNSISPSMMKTNMTKNIEPRMVEEIKSKRPLKKLLEPIEVAKAVNFLIEVGSSINGQNIIIDTH